MDILKTVKLYPNRVKTRLDVTRYQLLVLSKFKLKLYLTYTRKIVSRKELKQITINILVTLRLNLFFVQFAGF